MKIKPIELTFAITGEIKILIAYGIQMSQYLYTTNLKAMYGPSMALRNILNT
jgi:hypothetical protein